MEDTIERGSKASATIVDRALEEYSLKLLRGMAATEDANEYERLLAKRKKLLIRLPSARALGASRWLKKVG
ncbi:MAG: hypothetical protein COB16_18665 [Rhodobacteraceae bacterium]|nr:MAG: hypothetical protein COB16_18665 [Paracoccaceae bacterium]